MSKEKFIETYNQNIKREGADKLLAWLETSDFFTAPASTRFHGAHEGGLCEHSLNVYNRLFSRICNGLGNEPCSCEERAESTTIVTLLYDLCKANFYTVAYRNNKNEFGIWEKVPYYAVEEKLPYGRGEKSVYIISGFMRLTREEAMAIRWHMGGFDDSVKGGSYALSGAFEQYPLALMLHIADLEATYLDEKESK